MATYHSDLPQVFKALSDPTRLKVVERLVTGPASVTQLSEPFEMARPSFLKHLRVLEDAAIVSSVKKGRVRTVRLEPEVLDWVEAWVRRHRRRWEKRLDELGKFLEKNQEDNDDDDDRSARA